MHENILSLIRLKEIDEQIDELLQQRKKIPQEVSDIQISIQEFKENLTQFSLKLEKQEKVLKGLEIEIQEKKDKIQKSESKLEDIKNNKEYHALLKEISQLKKQLADLEDNYLKGLEELEKNKETFQNENQKYLNDKSQLNTLIEEKNKKENQLALEIEEKILSRKRVENEADPTTLSKYKSIKNRVSPAIALADNSNCMECYTQLPAQIFIELQRQDKVVCCPRCRRILYL